MEYTIKGKNLLIWKQILAFKSDSIQKAGKHVNDMVISLENVFIYPMVSTVNLPLICQPLPFHTL